MERGEGEGNPAGGLQDHPGGGGEYGASLEDIYGGSHRVDLIRLGYVVLVSFEFQGEHMGVLRCIGWGWGWGGGFPGGTGIPIYIYPCTVS